MYGDPFRGKPQTARICAISASQDTQETQMDTITMARLCHIAGTDAQAAEELTRHQVRSGERLRWQGTTGTLPTWALGLCAAAPPRMLGRFVASLAALRETPCSYYDSPSDWTHAVVLHPGGRLEHRERGGNGMPRDEWHGTVRVLWTGSGSVASLAPVCDAIQREAGGILRLAQAVDLQWDNGTRRVRLDEAGHELEQEIRWALDSVDCPQWWEPADWCRDGLDDSDRAAIRVDDEAWAAGQTALARDEGVWLSAAAVLEWAREWLEDEEDSNA